MDSETDYNLNRTVRVVRDYRANHPHSRVFERLSKPLFTQLPEVDVTLTGGKGSLTNRHFLFRKPLEKGIHK